ncbi:MAG: hypothetical protein JWL99_2883 [Streptomyces oryziradicis]|jgi:hypothetical protein|nr:hypothetical protein [Actinacidiphila oryziradicis]
MEQPLTCVKRGRNHPLTTHVTAPGVLRVTTRKGSK